VLTFNQAEPVGVEAARAKRLTALAEQVLGRSARRYQPWC